MLSAPRALDIIPAIPQVPADNLLVLVLLRVEVGLGQVLAAQDPALTTEVVMVVPERLIGVAVVEQVDILAPAGMAVHRLPMEVMAQVVPEVVPQAVIAKVTGDHTAVVV